MHRRSVQTEVRLDLAIFCHEPDLSDVPHLSPRPPIWLYVQSMSMSEDEARRRVIPTPSSAPLITTPTSTKPLQLEMLTTSAINILKKKASSDLQQHSSRGKRIKGEHSCDDAAEYDSVKQLLPDVDLFRMKNICNYLQSSHKASVQTAASRCIGYLETPHLYRHMFYFQDRNEARYSRSKQKGENTVYSLVDLMRHDVEAVVSIEDQLRLAHKTAIALLQYNDTPWLSDRWRLHDLSYSGAKNTLDNAALATLHLSSQISAPIVASAIGGSMDGVEQAETVISDQVLYGINNTSLFFLGVALLEIAHWKPIEEKMTTSDLSNEVFAARRLAAGRAPLGPQYQMIAEKCLQCNFGRGTKLSSESLQTAVYTDVVCELEAMIEKLTL